MGSERAGEPEGCWEAIIDEQSFHEAQAILKKNFRRHKTKYGDKRFPYLLTGVCVCGQCGDTLFGKSAHGNGGKIPYYEHAWSTRRQSCLNKKVFACKPNRVGATKLEPRVWEEIERLLTDPEIAQSLIKEAHEVHAAQGHVKEADKLRNRLRGIEEQIEAVAEHLTKIPKTVSPTPIFAQMERLEALKAQAHKDLENILQTGDASELPASLKDYQAYLVTLRRMMGFAESPELRRVIVRALVHKVEVLTNSFRMHYYVGEDRIRPDGWEPGAPPPLAHPSQANHDESKTQNGPPGIPLGGPFRFLIAFGSKTALPH